MNKKSKTLKAGLGNGLIVRKKSNEFDFELKMIDFDEEYAYGQSDINVDDGEYPHNCSGDYILPHLFSLDHLSKPMQIEGFNNGEEFVPIAEILKTEHKGHFNNHQTGKYSLIDYAQNEAFVKAWVKFDENKRCLLYTSIVRAFPKWVVELLNQWHFNIEKLPTNEFIDASISNVYTKD